MPKVAFKEAEIPNWPALMDETMGAAYCGGLCAQTFRALTSRYKIQPVDMGARLLRWRRADLDRMIDSLPPKGLPSGPQATAEPDSFDAALERAARRRRA